MKCGFNMCEKDRKDAAKFFKSIGMEYLTVDVIDNNSIEIEIEFLSTPDVLKTYSLKKDHYPSICKISAIGISFYLAVIDANFLKSKGKLILENDRNKVDGVVFCPMSNIKIINAFGKLRYEEDEKKANKKTLSKHLN